jgi:hypothetical protein
MKQLSNAQSCKVVNSPEEQHDGGYGQESYYCESGLKPHQGAD